MVDATPATERDAAKVEPTEEHLSVKPLDHATTRLPTRPLVSVSQPRRDGPVVDPRTLRSRSLSPLTNVTPHVVPQRSMNTVVKHSYRSTSALDNIPVGLLRRYPRFSTATTSIDTGRPNFSVEELTSTQLSDDEDDIVNDKHQMGQTSTGTLLRHRLTRDIRALWSSNASRLRCASQRIASRPQRKTTQICALQVETTFKDTTQHEVTPTNVAEQTMIGLAKESNTSEEVKDSENTGQLALPSRPDVGGAEAEAGDDCWRGERVAAMIRADLRHTQEATIIPRLRAPASVEGRGLVAPRALPGPRKASSQLPLMKLEAARIAPHSRIQSRRSSITSIGCTSLSHLISPVPPSSRPSIKRGRPSLSSSVGQHPNQTLYMDAQDPDTSFVFPGGLTDATNIDGFDSRPVSHSGSVFSFQTTLPAAMDKRLPRVEFGKPMPTGYSKVPVYTIRRIDKKDPDFADGLQLPALRDSPIAFEPVLSAVIDDSLAPPSKETISRASQWSTKVLTNQGERNEQNILMDTSSHEEDRKENFAKRSCQRLVRALSSRIGSNSLPGRLKSCRWKVGRPQLNNAAADIDTAEQGAVEAYSKIEVKRSSSRQALA